MPKGNEGGLMRHQLKLVSFHDRHPVRARHSFPPSQHQDPSPSAAWPLPKQKGTSWPI